MGKVCWDFPLLGTGNQSGNNNAAITMFKGSGVMDGLAREVCQNSLDAKDKDLPEEIPVKVKFELVNSIDKNNSIFDGYRVALKNSIDLWENSPFKTPKIMEFLDNIQKSLESDTISTLVMSDYNTTGLNGVNAKEYEKSFWDLLVNTEGISIKQDNNSAGSFGIGKNAPFAYSALSLVIYNTFAKDGGRALEGVARLMTSQRKYNGVMRKTQPIGKYLYLEDEYTGRPILPEDDCPIAHAEIFNRVETGTDVAVVGFKTEEYPEWERETAIAICKNFILAIMNGKLEVEIKSPKIEYEINSNNIYNLLFDKFKDEKQLRYTRQIYETIKMGTMSLATIAEHDDLSIYVKYEDNYAQSLSRFRSTGMLINTTTNDSLPHFSVVIIVNDVGEMKLSKTLRETEPPQHTEWKAKNVTDNRELHNLAARYIREITKAIQKVLDDYEKAEITDTMDAGIGNYLPDSSDASVSSEGTDGLRTDVKINDISPYDGRVFFNNQYENAENRVGNETSKNGVKTGKKKRKKKTKSKIPVVTPSSGSNKGVSSGHKKVKIVTLDLIEHRTYYISGNKYRLYVNSPKDYDNVYIKYFAGRDDDGQDALEIKNYKIESAKRVDVHGGQIGPISLKFGNNFVYVEFENAEIMAVIPSFTMEVSNEK